MILSKNLTFKYTPYDDNENLEPILKNINIKIKHGEFVAILGHNGSGKSTFARHLNALLSPTEGTLFINGVDTKEKETSWEIRQNVGMVFQNPDNQIIATVVEEDVAFGPENLGIPQKEIVSRVEESLKLVNMSKHSKAAPHHLSGGQKQRIAIAGVLAMKPGSIVLDEPTAMLDPSGRSEVMKTILKLNKEDNITIILITHFMEEAAKADRIIVMNNGKVVLDDSPRNVFKQSEKMLELGLGVPSITEVTHKLRKHGFDLCDGIITIDEFVNHKVIKSLLSKKVCSANFSQPVVNTETKGKEETPTVLEMVNVSHTYAEGTIFEKTALNNINIKIKQGEMLAIIGHTGSGKSTLIQHLNALLSPTSGVVLLKGENIHDDKSNLKQIRQEVGLVFQYPEHQLFEATVFKDVSFGPSRMELNEEEINLRTKKALTVVGLGEEYYDKSPFELSGGEKRRAAIAGVLAMQPQVLILDEPTAGLDPKGRDEILSQIKHMHITLGITVILISHSMDDAASLTNRVIVMNEGQLLHDKTPREIFSQSEELKKIGLDTPQISQLMEIMSKVQPYFPVGIFTVQEVVDVILELSKQGEVNE